MSEDILDGSCCALCTQYFGNGKGNIFSHGFPVVCNECWNELIEEHKRLYQKATAKLLED